MNDPRGLLAQLGADARGIREAAERLTRGIDELGDALAQLVTGLTLLAAPREVKQEATNGAKRRGRPPKGLADGQSALSAEEPGPAVPFTEAMGGNHEGPGT